MKTNIALFTLAVVGLVAVFALQPLFDTPMPPRISVTNEDLLQIAEQTARELAIPVDDAWVSSTWIARPDMERILKDSRELRRRAASDPVIGPRLHGYRVTYWRKDAAKQPPHGWVEVSPTGDVVAARRFAQEQDPAPEADPDDLRRKADAFVASRTLPGAPATEFESVRPDVHLSRTDHLFRYRVPTDFPSGDVAYLLGVYFIGPELAGWNLIEENTDGSPLAFNEGGMFAGFFGTVITMLGLLVLLGIIYLKKYHAGEVGVGAGALLLLGMMLLCIAGELATGRESATFTQIGVMPAFQVALFNSGFKIFFVHIPISVLVFLGWSVGESYARERWGDRLASFDALIKRDPINATVGNSLLRGLFLAPPALALALAISAIPVLGGWASPRLDFIPRAFGYAVGPWAVIIESASNALFVATVAYLFVIAALRSRVTRPVAVLLAVGLGTLVTWNVTLDPTWIAIVAGVGLALSGAFAFIAFDLLASVVTLFTASLLGFLIPLLRVADGAVFTEALAALLLPVGTLLAVAGFGIMTRREVEYTYDDLAPHVRRIVERERVKAEIDAANRIQAALLPDGDPAIRGVTISSHYRAATEIGGDYFDFLDLDDGRVGVAFGDVAGHGLTSGIVMAMAKAALLVQVDYDATPTRVMDVLNENVMRTAPRRMMMTFFFGILDPEKRIMRFSSAGHLDPYLYRKSTGTLECLSSWGYPLGIARREPFRELVVQFQPGDRLVLYSDGLIEAIDDSGEPFGFDRFEATLSRAALGTTEEIKKAVLQSVKKFTGNRPPEDDQTLVVIGFDAEGAKVARSA
jgi:hypothetical protein